MTVNHIIPQGDKLSLPPSLSHRFAILFQVLEVFSEFDTDAGHHVFGDELSLAGIIV